MPCSIAVTKTIDILCPEYRRCLTHSSWHNERFSLLSYLETLSLVLYSLAHASERDRSR